MATSNQPSVKGMFLARLVSKEPICQEHWRFVLEVEDFPPAAPGQFVQILCADPENDGWLSGALIRRPFSIAGVRRRGGRCELDILYRVVGVGTAWLSQLNPGDCVNIIGPLGRPFQKVEDRPAAWLVGGGIGLPPLIWLAEVLGKAGKQIMAFCGSRSADLLPLTRRAEIAVSGDKPTEAFSEFSNLDVPVVLATDDGSLGAAGRIPDVFALYVENHPEQARSACVYTCGPNGMMKTVAELCETHGIPCQVCLERMMACGMGTCQSCVVRVRDEEDDERWSYRLCCTDGPTFDSRTVIWDD